MALSVASSSARSTVFKSIAQVLCGNAGRHMASATSTANETPSYTYMPPGCSMREPLYFSMSDPVYFVDPKPEPLATPAATAASMQQQAAGFSAEEKASAMIAQQQANAANASSGQQQKQQQQQAQRPRPNTIPGPSTLRKIDLSHLHGKYADDGRPVSYRMQDDMAQVPYVTNPATNSMREPKYVSVSEPRYPVQQAPPRK